MTADILHNSRMTAGKFALFAGHPTFLHITFTAVRQGHLLIAIIHLDIGKPVILQIFFHECGNLINLLLINIPAVRLPGTPACNSVSLCPTLPGGIIFIAQMIPVIMHTQIDKYRLFTEQQLHLCDAQPVTFLKRILCPLPLASIHINQQILCPVIQTINSVHQQISVLSSNCFFLPCTPGAHIDRIGRKTKACCHPHRFFHHNINLLGIGNTLHCTIRAMTKSRIFTFRNIHGDNISSIIFIL